jgi:1-deoxy-D-xylulose-5-phosphate reductoisomerase
VIEALPGRFEVALLTCQRSSELLIEQAQRFRPTAVVVGEACYAEVRDALAGLPIAVSAGEAALIEAVQDPSIDILLTAVVGAAGLKPTLAFLGAPNASGKTLALANKETLVVAGELVMAQAHAAGMRVLPVDSEHSAIYQCLVGEPAESIQRLVLTASGGPFRGYSAEQLAGVSLEQALKHPNWAMGAKITIDSASMMNKGLEVIEARWLFGITPEQIDVIVHPQSIIHSLVEFADGSLKAQLGVPDMRLPIQYALTYPERPANAFPRFDFARYPSLTFESVDRGVFRTLDYAYHALSRGGNLPCALNAANEVAVAQVLAGALPFYRIYDVLEQALSRVEFVAQPSLDDLLHTDQHTRERLLAVV